MLVPGFGSAQSSRRCFGSKMIGLLGGGMFQLVLCDQVSCVMRFGRTDWVGSSQPPIISTWASSSMWEMRQQRKRHL